MSARIAIADLARMLHPRDALWRAVAMLRAYFDESGTHAEAPVTTIAGFIGTEAAWGEVEGRWRPILDEYEPKGVKSFHMAPALAQDGEFSGIDQPHLNYILTQLSAALGDSDVRPVFSGVVQDDWDEVVIDPVFLKRFPKPFDLCFDDIVRQLSEWSRREAGGEPVAPMFAYQLEYHSRMADVGRVYGAEPWYREALGPVSFGHPEQVIPLQGADMLAHEMAVEIERRQYGPLSGRRKVLADATGHEHIKGHWFNADALRLTIRRYRETGEIYSVR